MVRLELCSFPKAYHLTQCGHLSNGLPMRSGSIGPSLALPRLLQRVGALGFSPSLASLCRPFHSAPQHFSSPTPSKQLESTANMGKCISTLQLELEAYCQSGLKDFSIYSKDVQFYDPYTKLHLKTRTQYKWGSRLLRCMLNTHYISPEITLSSLLQKELPIFPPPSAETQPSSPLLKEYSLFVGFIFTGIPRFRWYWSRIVSPHTPVNALISEFECWCVYIFDQSGKVKSHWIQRVRPQPTFWKVLHWAPWVSKKFSSGDHYPHPGLGLELTDYVEKTKL